MTDDEMLAAILGEVRAFARRVDLPDFLRDEVVSATALLVASRLPFLRELSEDVALRWVRGTVFMVARNTKRAEMRKTAAWRRLRAATPHPRWDEQEVEDLTPALLAALGSIGDEDRKLLMERIWDGKSIRTLALDRGLSQAAVRQRISRSRAAVRAKFLTEVCHNDEPSGH